MVSGGNIVAYSLIIKNDNKIPFIVLIDWVNPMPKSNFKIQNPLNQQKTNLMTQIHENIKLFLKNL